MVERLKAAIEKARLQREADGDPAPRARRAEPPSGGWEALAPLTLDPAQLARERIVSHSRSEAAHVMFDVLRTRLLKACRDNGWSRIMITSPTKGCGKTMITGNLALALGRQTSLRTLVYDLDLRAPRLNRVFGVAGLRFQNVLEERVAIQDHARRVGDNLALVLNDGAVPNSAELLQSPAMGALFERTADLLRPDLTLIDSAPLLVSDDALALLPHVDAALLVLAAGSSTAAEAEEAEQMLASGTTVLGVVLNKCVEMGADAHLSAYAEGYAS